MWSETIAFVVGNKIVGIGVDSRPTARRVRDVMSRYEETESDRVRPVWGVRAEGRRLMQRRTGVLHHGKRIVERFRSVDDAIATLDTVLAGIEEPPHDGVVRAEARLLMIHGLPVLYLPPPDTIVHDLRRLSAAGIHEVPTYRVAIDESTAGWFDGADCQPFAAIVVTAAREAPPIDTALRRVWEATDGATIEFAEALDRVRPSLRRIQMETSEDGLIDLARELRPR